MAMEDKFTECSAPGPILQTLSSPVREIPMERVMNRGVCIIQGSDYKNSLKSVQRTDLRLILMVRGRGLEPLRITPLEPKSSASAISPPAREIAPRGDSSVMRKRVASVSRMNRLEQYRAEVSFSQNSRRKLLMYFMTGFLPGKTAILSIFSKLPRISFSGISNSIQ